MANRLQAEAAEGKERASLCERRRAGGSGGAASALPAAGARTMPSKSEETSWPRRSEKPSRTQARYGALKASKPSSEICMPGLRLPHRYTSMNVRLEP